MKWNEAYDKLEAELENKDLYPADVEMEGLVDALFDGKTLVLQDGQDFVGVYDTKKEARAMISMEAANVEDYTCFTHIKLAPKNRFAAVDMCFSPTKGQFEFWEEYGDWFDD